MYLTASTITLTHFPTQYRSGQRYGKLTLRARGQTPIDLSDGDGDCDYSQPSLSFSGRLLWYGYWQAQCDCGQFLTIHTSRIAEAMRRAGLNKVAETVAVYRASDLNDARLWVEEQEMVGLRGSVRRYADPDDYDRRHYVGLAYQVVSGGEGVTGASEVMEARLACKQCRPKPVRPDLGGTHNYPATRRSRAPIQLSIVRKLSAQPGTDYGRLTTVIYQVRRGWVCFCNECETYLTVRYSKGLREVGAKKCKRPCGEGSLEI